jgi:hypothetical protein
MSTLELRRVIIPTAALVLSAMSLAAAERDFSSTERFPTVEGKRVLIDAASLNVRLRAADVQRAEVLTELRISGVGADRADGWITAHTPSFSDATNELRVEVELAKSGFLGIGHLTSRARLRVVVPFTVVPDLTTTGGAIQVGGDFPLASPLRLRTSGGDMDFRGAAGSLEIRTASGNAEVSLVRPLDGLFARSSSGKITLAGGARHVEVDTASGGVTLSNLSGSAVVETSTGKVNLHWDRLDPEHTVMVHSTSGKVQISVPAGVQPRGTLTTTTGTIRCDLPGTLNERGDTFHFAGDGPRFDVETASSEIEVALGSIWQ